ncbi:MAG: ABC transporter permease [Myxococcota bacterium]
MSSTRPIRIAPPSRWPRLDIREIWAYRGLLRYLVWRNIRVRYAQTVLGALWAVFRPGVTALLFTVVFGRLAQMPSDGVPYPLFALCALVPWGYFAGATSATGSSLVSNQRLITKVYFARLVIPLSALFTALVDFSIAFAVLLIALLATGHSPSMTSFLTVPALVILMMITALGFGLWISAATILYRDVGAIVAYGIQALLFVSPVVYSVSLVPETLRPLYAINPMATVIEGFRTSLLGTGTLSVEMVFASMCTATVLLASGVWYFRSMEHSFADVV